MVAQVAATDAMVRVPDSSPSGGRKSRAAVSTCGSRKVMVLAALGAIPFLCASALIVCTAGTRKSRAASGRS